MNILPKMRIAGLALFLEDSKTLVITDTHIGYEEELNKKGFLIPRLQFGQIIKNLNRIFSKVKPEMIIINGDIKHEFGTISKQEWNNTMKLLEYLEGKCKKIVLVKGNHDKQLGPIAKKKEIEIVNHILIGDILICHGDKIIKTKKKPKIVIIGHDHPAVSIAEGARKEKFKCFLKGKYKNSRIIVQPSFNTITEGTDMITEERLSPYLKKDISNFEVYIVADKTYDFGKLKNMGRD